MGGEKYSKFLKAQFQIFQPRFSLLYSIRHSISLTTFLADARLLLTASLRLLYKNVCYTAGSRAFARPPYTIHIDSLRQSLKIGRSRSLFASLSNPSISFGSTTIS